MSFFHYFSMQKYCHHIFVTNILQKHSLVGFYLLWLENMDSSIDIAVLVQNMKSQGIYLKLSNGFPN